ncbi:MAG: alpha/beta hydrolase [Bacteroidota bacterium]
MKKMLALLLGLFAAHVLQAQEADTLNIPNAILIKRIPYVVNGHKLQNLDIYITKNATKPMPLLIWIHGGAWEGGLKKWIDPAYLLNSGYAIASIDYRFSGDAIFPAQVIDCNEAALFLWDHATEYGFDKSKFIIGGGSAGGHLSSLIGLSANNNKTEFYNNIKRSRQIKYKAIVDFYGPSDLNVVHGKATAMDYDSENSALTRLLGHPTLERPDIAAQASPVTYIDKNDPPIIILHGDADDIVPFWESKLFYSKLRLAGVQAELVKLAGAGHGGAQFSSKETQKKLNDFLINALHQDK